MQRVPTGFAIRAKNPDAKTRLLEASSTFTQVEAKLEPPSDIVSLRIATVPVAVFGLEGRIGVTAEMVAAEILRVTNCTPDRVRIHGNTKLGAPYRSWAALFPRNASPKPGFRLFDDSGVATIQRNRPAIQQCRRCLGFHATRGCSRAPACWNCGSTMHSLFDCKAASKCRNCGSPHQSGSRDCLARPNRSGPATREQLVTIRQAGQREYQAVARAKAATAAARSTRPTSPAAVKDNLSTDTAMTEGLGFGALNLEEAL